MASAAEQLAANLNFSALAKAEELKKRIWFTVGALLVYRLGTYIPLPGIDPAIWEQVFQHPVGRHPRHVQHVLGRRHSPHGDLRPEHHALHLGLHHHPADDDGVAHPRAAQEGGRVGPQDDEPVHPLPDGLAGGLPVLRHRGRPQGSGNVVSDPGPDVPHLDRDHAHRRHHLPDVARRAGDRARHRQRHLADHHVGHRGRSCRRRSRRPSSSGARARFRACSFSPSWWWRSP